jgi:hypothetical protein
MNAKSSILQALQSGQRLTVLNMLIRFHTTAGQQRINEHRRAGEPILDEWTILVSASGKKRIKTYFMNPAPGSIPDAQAPERPSSVPLGAGALDLSV